MTMPPAKIGIAATNAPAKPLKREGIRCMKLSPGRRSNLGKETISAAGLSTAVAQAGVSVQPASAKGRDPCRLRRRHRSSKDNQSTAPSARPAEFKEFVVAKPTTRDKLYDLVSYVRKLKINIACTSEMKNFNPGGERVSFISIEEFMFILAESTGILDPRCRLAFQNGGSTLQVGSERSLLIKLQFPTGSLAVGAVYFPTGAAAAMRDLELLNVLSLISLAKSWKNPMYICGHWNGHIGNDHGVDDIHIGPYTSTTATLPKGFVFARTFANDDLFLEDSFHSLARRGTWRYNNGNWYEYDVVWTDTRAHHTVSQIKCSHASFSDHVVKRYKIDISAGQGKNKDQCERNSSK